MSIRDIPQLKVNIADTDYTSEVLGATITLRENNYSIAKIYLDNHQSKFYTSLVNTFDEVEVYAKEYSDGAWTQLFGGYARDLLPVHNQQGETLTLGCKGYGINLAETHVARDYGYESSMGASADELSEIIADVLVDFNAKSFNAWATGWVWNTTYISDTFDATLFTYINNPYRTCMDVINHCCILATAIAAGTNAEAPAAAGAHWICKPSGGVAPYFLLGKIGDHTAGAGGTAPSPQWPDWWNTNQAGSTLVQGDDFKSYEIIDKSGEFANSVVLLTDFRRPSWDYWTTDAVANGLWGDEDVTQADDGATVIVGNDSLKATVEAAAGNAYLYYPSTENAGWDIYNFGSQVTVPTINFYYMQNDLAIGGAYLALFTTDHDEDAWVIDFTDWNLEDNVWHHFSIPIGPYYQITSQPKEVVWTNGSVGADIAAGAPDWSDINGICFVLVSNGTANEPVYHIDDLHFTGKTIRQAYCDDDITTHNEYQKVIISRASMDDTLLSGTPGTTDVGDAARICKAELFRRMLNPITVRFTTDSLKKAMLAGQKTHTHAGLQSDGSTFTVNADMRIMQVEHGIMQNVGAYSTVTATTDLYNTFPISATDAWALQQEYMMMNSREAKNIRAGAEVDLLIPILKENYT